MRDTVISYIRSAYDVEPETPWVGYPDNMTFKDKWSDKWFALILPVAYQKLGIQKDGEIFVLNVKAEPEMVGLISSARGFLPAYHMNKRHWISVLLDGSVSAEQIYERIDDSFRIVTDTPTRRIYEAVRRIPYGRVASYGTVAAMAGDRKMARAVGNALHKNPDPEHIPCFRVVNSKGELAGEFAFGGKGEQAKLLEAEGIHVKDGKVDLSVYGIPADI